MMLLALLIYKFVVFKNNMGFYFPLIMSEYKEV